MRYANETGTLVVADETIQTDDIRQLLARKEQGTPIRDRLRHVEVRDVHLEGDVDELFFTCTALETVTFANVDATGVTSAEHAFSGCACLETADLSTLAIPNVQSLEAMFCGCTSLVTVRLPNDLGNLQCANSLFVDCSALERIDLEGYNLSRCSQAINVFARCARLRDVRCAHAHLEALEHADYLFAGCSALESVDVTGAYLPRHVSLTGATLGCPRLQTARLRCNAIFDDDTTQTIMLQLLDAKDTLRHVELCAGDSDNVDRFASCATNRSTTIETLVFAQSTPYVEELVKSDARLNIETLMPQMTCDTSAMSATQLASMLTVFAHAHPNASAHDFLRMLAPKRPEPTMAPDDVARLLDEAGVCADDNEVACETNRVCPVCGCDKLTDDERVYDENGGHSIQTRSYCPVCGCELWWQYALEECAVSPWEEN
jgi:hypothetical protein